MSSKWPFPPLHASLSEDLPPLPGYPLCRLVISFFKKKGGRHADFRPTLRPPMWYSNLWRTFLVLVTVGVAMLIPYFGNFVAVIGSVGSTCLAIIFPCLFHWKLRRPFMSQMRVLWICLSSLCYALEHALSTKTHTSNMNKYTHTHSCAHTRFFLAIHDNPLVTSLNPLLSFTDLPLSFIFPWHKEHHHTRREF